MDEPREWTLRIHSNNDGGGYLYSGSDVNYPEDDYLKVVEKSAYEELKELIRSLKYELNQLQPQGRRQTSDD